MYLRISANLYSSRFSLTTPLINRPELSYIFGVGLFIKAFDVGVKLKQKQKDWIISQLIENGEITRNKCLKNYISRLAMHIDQLKKQGWEFETERVKVKTPMGWTGNDYKYILVSFPENIEVA
jgi:hypothetical protein